METDITKIVNEILAKLYDDIDYETLKKIEAVIYTKLSKYTISEKTTEIIPYQGDITENLIKRFLVEKKLKNCSDRTLFYYKDELVKAFGEIEKNPLEITTDDIKMFLLKMKMSGTISDVTINSKRRILSSFFGWIQLEGIRNDNPIIKTDKLKERKIKKEAFTELELEKMRISIDNKKDKAIFETLVSTWARISEVVNIKISDIQGEQAIVHGKGNKDRNVYFTPKAQLAIEEYLAERNDKNPYLFPKKKQGSYKKDWWKYEEYVDDVGHADTSSVECFVRKLGRKHDIKAHPHKFRRTGATMALRKGMPLTIVSKTLGHESIDTTQIYLSIDDSEIKDAHIRYC